MGKYIEFLPGKKHGTKDADTSDYMDAFTDCGYLLQENEVVVDIDHVSRESILAMIDTFKISTEIVWTDRGVHLYYTLPVNEQIRPVKHICALGFEVELKTVKNCPKGITRKRDGIARKCENENMRQVIPWYFTSLKRYQDLNGMNDGEGRNMSLFKHVGKLEADHELIAGFINKHIFADPMDQRELDTVVAQAGKMGKAAKEENNLADMLMEKYKTKRYLNFIWMWDGVKYVPDKDDLLLTSVYEMARSEKTAFIKEVAEQIKLRSERVKDSAFIVKFRNGYVDDGKFYYDKTIDVFTPFYIDIDYDPDAEPVEVVDNYINDLVCNDEDYRKLLLESMAYPLITDLFTMAGFAKFFILRGDGQNGKGTFFNILRTIYGNNNCCSFSPQQLKDDRYLISCVGKLVNLGDDIPPTAFDNDTMKTLKNLASADSVGIRRLYHEGEQGRMPVKMFFSTNADIKTWEKGYAYQRRVVWLPMFNVIKKKDPKFVSKVTSPEALRYWVRLIIEGYERLYKNGEFTTSEKVDEYNQSYHRENNHMYEFLELIDVDTNLIDHSVKEVRRLYDDVMDDPRGKPYNARMLNDILKQMGITTQNKRFEDGTVKKAFKKVTR